MRGRFVLLGTAVALGAAFPATAATPTMHYRVVSAKATATLTFATQNADQSSLLNGRIALAVTPKKRGSGMLGARTGRVLFATKGTINELVKKRTRLSDDSPYQETTCADRRNVGGRGGVRLVRKGNRVEVRWAFAQAKPSFCPGPTVGKTLTKAMKKLLPSSRFAAGRVTIVLAGLKRSKVGGTTLTYRWRATIKLVRT